MTEHTLLVVEEDVDESPGTYSVTQLEHPPDSPQVQYVKEAMKELKEEAVSQTGTEHRVVTKSGDPDTIEADYSMYVAAAEQAADGNLLTDGGVGENKAIDDQNPRTVSVCWAGGMNGLGDALLHRREDDKACGNQPDTSLGTDLETAAVEDGNELCSACEWPDGCEAVLAGEYMATDGGTEDAEAGRSPEEARIQKLEERNADLIGAIEEVRDLLKPFDVREQTGETQDGDGQYEVVIHGNEGIEKEHAELLRKELVHKGYYEDVLSVRKIGGEPDGSHTITCGYCGATNDLEAAKHEGCCHDCRGDIDV